LISKETGRRSYSIQRRSYGRLPGLSSAGASSPVVLRDGRVFVSNVQAGPIQGRVGTALVGGQVFDPAAGDWTFATTTSVPIASVYLLQGVTSLAVALPSGDAVIVHSPLALAFHPAIAPPAAQVLDSTGLTLTLLALAAVLVLLLAVVYVRGGTRGGGAPG
jgi:hypothetical protein